LYKVREYTHDKDVQLAALAHKVEPAHLKTVLKETGCDKTQAKRVMDYVKILHDATLLPSSIDYRNKHAVQNRIDLILKIAPTYVLRVLVLADKHASISAYSGQKDLLDQVALIYAPMADRLGLIILSSELQEEVFKHGLPQHYFVTEAEILTALRVSSRKEAEEDLRKTADAIEAYLGEKLDGRLSVYHRVKKAFPAWLKVHFRSEKHPAIAGLGDLRGITVVLEDVTDVYAVLSYLGVFPPDNELRVAGHVFVPQNPQKFVDTKKLKMGADRPMLFRYHLDLVDENGMKYEIQVCSGKVFREMFLGRIAHWSFRITQLPYKRLQAQVFDVVDLSDTRTIQDISARMTEHLEPYVFVNVLDTRNVSHKRPLAMDTVRLPAGATLGALAALSLLAASHLQESTNKVAVSPLGGYLVDSKDHMVLDACFVRSGNYVLKDGDLVVFSEKGATKCVSIPLNSTMLKDENADNDISSPANDIGDGGAWAKIKTLSYRFTAGLLFVFSPAHEGLLAQTSQENPVSVEQTTTRQKNLLAQGVCGEYKSWQWQSKAIWWDFKRPIELKGGQKLRIRYAINGSDVIGVQFVPVGQSEDACGDMIVVRGVSGKNTFEVAVPSTRMVWRIAFQFGKNAWGRLGGSYHATLQVHSVEKIGQPEEPISSPAFNVKSAWKYFSHLLGPKKADAATTAPADADTFVPTLHVASADDEEFREGMREAVLRLDGQIARLKAHLEQLEAAYAKDKTAGTVYSSGEEITAPERIIYLYRTITAKEAEVSFLRQILMVEEGQGLGSSDQPLSSPVAQAVIFAGVSGSGKSTYIERLLAERGESFVYPRLTTTRPAWHGETPNRYRVFVPKEDFLERLHRFHLARQRHGYWYGIDAQELEEAEEQGKAVLFDTSSHESLMMHKAAFPQARTALILPVAHGQLSRISEDILKGVLTARMAHRKLSPQQLEVRLAEAVSNIMIFTDRLGEFDRIIENSVPQDKDRNFAILTSWLSDVSSPAVSSPAKGGMFSGLFARAREVLQGHKTQDKRQIRRVLVVDDEKPWRTQA
ncbi:MAG: hypothetical protein PHF12_08120, partial [Candidatus Omnitrophica bacterium]|nr:hypothetical protein [Candidatus Omnitrophota bacterium]